MTPRVIQCCQFQKAGYLLLLLLPLTLGCNPEQEPIARNAIRSDGNSNALPVTDDSTPAIPPPTKLPSGTSPSNTTTASELANTSRNAAIEKSLQLVNAGDYAGATALLNSLLLKDPTDVEVLFHLANANARKGDLNRAIELLGDIPADHPQAGLPALGQSAAWCVTLERYDNAETLYRNLLSRAPTAAPALRQLAHLLNRQGRRHEAANLIRQLCLLGNVRQDELHALMALSNAMYDEPSQDRAASTRSYWPIGASGLARKRFEEEQYNEVVKLLEPSVSEGTARPAVVALYGRAVAEAQDDQRFQWWLSLTGAETRQFSEYWAAIGTHLLAEGNFRVAVRALSEAVDRDPTDLRSISRIRQALLALDQPEAAAKFADRWTSVRDSLRDNNLVAGQNPPGPDAIYQLATQLKDLERPLEALLWQAIAQHYQQAPATERQKLNQQRQQLVGQGIPFPDTTGKLCGLDLESYPLPKLNSKQPMQIPQVPSDSGQVASTARFKNIAAQIGLRHTFSVARQPQSFGYAIHQMLGGGVAVFDYDNDGGPDLYLAQGNGDPPEFKASRSNILMRHIDSAYVETAAAAGVQDFGYTMGVATGDWNQDGFVDLVLRNILSDQLFLNQGDGSFKCVVLSDHAGSHRVPASAAIADLTGDGLPDIYHANYVDDPRRFVTPPTDPAGRPLQPILPSKFQPGKNELVENDGTGNFQIRELSSAEDSAATSLGLIVTDFNGVGGNEIFVANDMKPNQLWQRDSSGPWQDMAALRGCAFSSTGASTASMGVAAADLLNNGTLDLHITNYQSESASLFVNQSGMFKDRNLRFRIAEASQSVLGFGTQAFDYDNDGLRDLVVTNGHIDDAVDNEGTFKQPAQLFANLRTHFEVVPVIDPSNYWSQQHLGRALATLDFDANGAMDFVVTHLEEPSALLLNETKTNHNWLQIKLVGTVTERDAVGARLRVHLHDQIYTEWVTAGDGYLCSNENISSFGLGAALKVDALEILWPTGKTQAFHDIPANQRILVVEGAQNPFNLSATNAPVAINNDSN